VLGVVQVVVLAWNRNEAAVWHQAGNADHLYLTASALIDHELPSAGPIDGQLVFIDTVIVAGLGDVTRQAERD
jgi:hypothetical protein